MSTAALATKSSTVECDFVANDFASCYKVACGSVDKNLRRRATGMNVSLLCASFNDISYMYSSLRQYKVVTVGQRFHAKISDLTARQDFRHVLRIVSRYFTVGANYSVLRYGRWTRGRGRRRWSAAADRVTLTDSSNTAVFCNCSVCVYNYKKP